MTSQDDGIAILCVEDNRHVRRALQRALSGNDVLMVDGVEDAKRRLAAKDVRFEAFVLDVHLPDGSGLELLAWVRQRGIKTPVLVMTGLDERALANEAQKLGAEFLYKPFSKAALDGFVARARRRRPGPLDLVDELAKRLAMPRREHDILDALARGVSRADLPRALGISNNTVKTYVRRLLARTSSESLDDLLRSLLKKGT